MMNLKHLQVFSILLVALAVLTACVPENQIFINETNETENATIENESFPEDTILPDAGEIDGQTDGGEIY